MFMAKFLNIEKWKAEESPSQKKKKEKKKQAQRIKERLPFCQEKKNIPLWKRLEL